MAAGTAGAPGGYGTMTQQQREINRRARDLETERRAAERERKAQEREARAAERQRERMLETGIRMMAGRVVTSSVGQFPAARRVRHDLRDRQAAVGRRRSVGPPRPGIAASGRGRIGTSPRRPSSHTPRPLPPARRLAALPSRGVVSRRLFPAEPHARDRLARRLDPRASRNRAWSGAAWAPAAW